MKCHPKHIASGFTLVELAVSLIIIALLIGGLTMPLSAQIELRDINETRKQLDEAREALLGYAAINGHLPCPASKVSNGVSVACGSTAAQDGILPWADLGLPRSDSWGHYIRYRVLLAFSNPASPIALSTALTPTLTIYTRDASGNPVPLTNTSTPSIVAVLVSHGRNGYFGTSDTSGVSVATANLDEKANDDAITGAATMFYQRSPSKDTSGNNTEFDDQLTWIPVSTLMSRLVTAGKVTSN